MSAGQAVRAALLSAAAVLVSAAAPANRSGLVLDPSGPPGNLLISVQAGAASISSSLTIEHLAEGRWAPVPTRFDAVARC